MVKDTGSGRDELGPPLESATVVWHRDQDHRLCKQKGLNSGVSHRWDFRTSPIAPLGAYTKAVFPQAFVLSWLPRPDIFFSTLPSSC